MTSQLHTARNQSLYQSSPVARDAINWYLFWLAAACLISSIYVGPTMILVWIITAVLLTQIGDLPTRSAPKSKH